MYHVRLILPDKNYWLVLQVYIGECLLKSSVVQCKHDNSINGLFAIDC